MNKQQQLNGYKHRPARHSLPTFAQELHRTPLLRPIQSPPQPPPPPPPPPPLPLCAPVPPSRWPCYSVAVLSDSPYGIEQFRALPTLISDLNAQTDLLSVVHLGDIKLGGDMCNDTYITSTKSEYFDKITIPLLYTPGDNEWTDCHRISNGNHRPLERLEFLRTTFFPSPGLSTGARFPIPVTSQKLSCGFSEFVENSIWEHERVVLATIHVVGSNNDRDPWDELQVGDFTDARVDEYQRRDAASAAWLDKTFERATSSQSKGVLLFIHGAMWLHFELANDIPLYGFDNFAQALSRHASKFAKPVWLLNGDTHDFVRLRPFTPGAVHPTTKFFGKPNVPIYRVHGEEYDAPLFQAFTAETVDRFDGPDTEADYDPNLQWEWIEIKIRQDSEQVFALERHRILRTT